MLKAVTDLQQYRAILSSYCTVSLSTVLLLRKLSSPATSRVTCTTSGTNATRMLTTTPNVPQDA